MKRNVLLCSILSIVLCFSMIVGSAFALFTDSDSLNVAVMAGNVQVEATAENFELSSTLGANLPETSVTYRGNTIILDRIVPGDVLHFDIRIHNESDVAVLYRTALTRLDDGILWDALVVEVDGDNCGDSRITAWKPMSPNDEDVIVSVTISLPESADNTYQGTSCIFAYAVEVIQGNANVKGKAIADGVYLDEEYDIYRISNANGLRYVAELINAGDNFAGKKVELVADIDLENALWTPMRSFAGEFDGNGYSISNIRFRAESGSYGGLFNVIEGGDGERVHDLTITGVEATVGDGRFGVLANSVQGRVRNVTVNDVLVTTTSEEAWVGGLCSFLYWPEVRDCTVSNLVVDARQGATFVAGFSPILQKNENVTFTNCNVNGFYVTLCSDEGTLVGGFVSQTQRGWESPKLEDCHVTDMDIVAEGVAYIGGFIGAPGAHTTLIDCSAEGKIDGTGLTDGYIGGFLGDLGWNDDLANKGGHKLYGCTADVDITTGTVVAGGFVGTATNENDRTMPAAFYDCVASGDISATGNAVIGGFAGDADRGSYVRCSATGTVNGVAADDSNFIGKILPDADISITQ